MYYVIYTESFGDTVYKFQEKEEAFSFIKEVMEENSDYELDDFEVVFGEPLELEIKEKIIEIGFSGT